MYKSVTDKFSARKTFIVFRCRERRTIRIRKFEMRNEEFVACRFTEKGDNAII